ncbi:MAG: hypothetical protein Q7S66_03750 [bacterium]|nr:hypothetical protein [bacterium]
MDPIETTLHLNEFFVEGGNQKKSHVLLHITEPSTPEERDRGYFFAVCETNGADNTHILRLQSAIDEMENIYYEAKANSDDTAKIFEEVLEKVNAMGVADLPDQVSLYCAVGIIRPPEIILAFHNKPQLVLFYRKKDGEYQKIDIVKANSDGHAPKKNLLFSQVIQGKISPLDYLFVGSPHIADYFSQDRLQKIITSREPSESASHLEKVLTELRNGSSFGGLIIYPTPSETYSVGKHAVLNEKPAKVNRLFLTEQHTAQTLAPSISGSVGQKIKSWQDNLVNSPVTKPAGIGVTATTSHVRNRARAEAGSGAEWLASIRTVGSYLFKFILWVAAVILALIKLLAGVLKTLFFLATNFRNKRTEVIADYKRQWQNYKHTWQQLPAMTKWLVFTCLAVLVVIVGGIYILNNKKQAVAQQTAFDSMISRLNEATDAAESALVYENSASALEQINAAQAIYTQLPCDTKKFKTDCQTVADKIQSTTAKAKKITTVEPQLVADWSGSSAVSQPTQIMRVGNKIMGAGQGKPVMYDLMTKTTSVLDTGYDKLNFISASVPKENDYGLLLAENNQLFEFNPSDSSFKKADVGFPSGAKIAGIVVYNRRLYSLDAVNSQIYKHDSIKTGFGPAKAWLKTPADLTKSADLTVEGDVFVLADNGTIQKFTKGQTQTFALQDLNPALVNGGKIWSYNDLQYLYILDPAGKRLIIVDKIGVLKAQVTSDKFVNPTGMIVDEVNKSAYILDSNKLYQIPLP